MASSATSQVAALLVITLALPPLAITPDCISKWRCPPLFCFAVVLTNMPAESTKRRHRRADRIDSLGDVMPRKCLNCRKANTVCKVHISSGSCGACNRRGNRDCDVKVTEAEWERLLKARRDVEIQLERARSDRQEAQAREDRLFLQLKLLNERGAEALAVEEREILALEASENALPEASYPLGGVDPLALSPLTWSAVAGLSDDFWNLETPEVSADSSGGGG